MRSAYYSRNSPGVWLATAGFALVVLGMVGTIVVLLIHASITIPCTMMVIGNLVLALGARTFGMMRVVVAPGGVSRLAFFRTRWTFRWDDVVSWSVDADQQQAVFRLHGKPTPVVVTEADVESPGFEPFLAEVRQAVAAKETGAAPS